MHGDETWYACVLHRFHVDHILFEQQQIASSLSKLACSTHGLVHMCISMTTTDIFLYLIFIECLPPFHRDIHSRILSGGK